MKLRDIIIVPILLLIVIIPLCLLIIPAWLINWPIRKMLGYEHRDFDYFLNCLADHGPIHPRKGQRFGSWNPFRKSDWY